MEIPILVESFLSGTGIFFLMTDMVGLEMLPEILKSYFIGGDFFGWHAS